MKKNLYLLALLLINITILSCNSEDEPSTDPIDDPIQDNLSEPGTFRLGSFTVTDIDNFGDASDISISFEVISLVSELDELTLLVSPNSLSLEDAQAVAADNTLILDPTESYSASLPTTIVDTDGNSITEDQAYNIYLLATFNNDQFTPTLSDPASVTITNETIIITPELTGTFSATEDIAIDSEGNLYINGGSASPSSVFKVTPEGESTILSSAFDNPVGIDVDSEGNVYVSNFGNTNINRIDSDGNSSVLVSDSRLAGGGGIAVANDGAIYNTYWATTNLFRVLNNELTVVCQHSQFNGPVGVTYDKENSILYVASFNTGKIFRVEDDFTITEVADSPLTIGHVAYADGFFYATGWNEHQVQKIAIDGTITETYGTGISGTTNGGISDAQFSRPNGVAVTPDGKYIYVTQGDGKLRKIINARVN
ncbi:MAG: hypothetical protein NXI20_09505 [bacterium]|nr:hypothetical protein [bacterium]